MPKRDKLLGEIEREDGVAAFLMAQAGGMPNELQLFVQTATFIDGEEAFKPQNTYVIRVLGAQEYRINNLGGTVGEITFLDDHPLLLPYNQPAAALFFRGDAPADVNELIIDLTQTHASTLLPWRHFPEYMNIGQPLVTLFQSGGGLVGQMPLPLAEKMAAVLEKHGLETKIMSGEDENGHHHNHSQKAQALLIGSSYFVSYAFSVEELGKV